MASGEEPGGRVKVFRSEGDDRNWHRSASRMGWMTSNSRKRQQCMACVCGVKSRQGKRARGQERIAVPLALVCLSSVGSEESGGKSQAKRSLPAL
jgi:hypothetical protein